jgi:T5SS/PEP-CTERM-associated repeat protein
MRRSLHISGWPLLVGLAAVLLPPSVVATPVTFSGVSAFRDHEGPNTIGVGVGENITVRALGVSPNLSTLVTATAADGTRVQLLNLFSQFGFVAGILNRDFARDIPYNPALTPPWTIEFQNRADTASAQTNRLAGVPLLPLPVIAPVANALTPSVNWTNPPAGFNRTFVEVWDDATNTNIATFGCAGGADTCTNFTIPVGILAPNGQYAARVLVQDRGNPADPATLINRSNATQNFVATTAARENGVVQAIDLVNGGDTGAVIVSGANSLPGVHVAAGATGARGALTIDSSSSLSASLLSAGFFANSFGNVLVDGGTVTLNGTIGTVVPQGQAGFVLVGHSGTGFATFTNGATVNINAAGYAVPGFAVGRFAGGVGDMQVAGAGTTITIDGSTVTNAMSPLDWGLIRIGREGSGRLTISGGAVVSNDPRGLTDVGGLPGDLPGRGSITVEGNGSRLNAGAVLNVGGGTGEGRVSAQNGGVVAATNINVGTGGFLTGDGTFVGTVTLMDGGFISPGLSPGLLTIEGDLILDGGTLLMEAFSQSEVDRIRVTGNAIFGAAVIQLLLDFVPDPGFVFDLFDVVGLTEILPTFGGIEAFALAGSGAGGSEIQVLIGNQIFSVTVVGVPEPGSFALLGLALGVAVLVRRVSRRAKSPLVH